MSAEKWLWLKVVFFVILVKVVRFNRERAAPDVSQEEHSHSLSATNLPTETGFRYADFMFDCNAGRFSEHSPASEVCL